MKNTIEGFNQNKLIEYGLGLKDAVLLRFCVDFMNSGKMSTIISDEKVYYWVSYKHVIEDLPILEIKNNDAIRNRFKKLEKAGLIEHYHSKEGGSYSYYRLTEKYCELLTIDEKEKFNEDLPSELKSAEVPIENSTPTDENSEQNNLSTKDNNIYSANDVEELWSAYPNKRGKVQGVKKISKILKKISKDELMRCIKRYSCEALGKEKQFILNGSTFFNGRYEDYLDCNYTCDVAHPKDIPKLQDDSYEEEVVFEEEL